MSKSIKQDYEGVALVCPVTVPYKKRSDHGAEWFIGSALAELIKKSGLNKTDIDGLAVSSLTLAPDSGVGLTTYFSMTPRWLETIPLGGASGVVAMRRAARAVQAGDAEVVACIAGDTANENSHRDLINNFSRFSREALFPHGGGGPNTVFAMITRNYMEQYGVTREDFGRICIAQRENALAASTSLFQKPLTMDDYINARPVAEPLHLFDCVMPCAGAEGFLVMSVERAQSLNLPYVTILASEELHNAYFTDDIQFRGGWDQFRDTLFEESGVGHNDIDFIETYDDYPVIVMLQIEDLGFCDKGEAAKFIRETSMLWNGGGLPNNTSGGQLSAGQAAAAGGFIGLVEAIRQLTDPGIKHSIPGAKTALVSGYGMVVYDRCLSICAVIISKGE